ncbi:MAG: hypothetical protein PHW46_00365 [Candidatus Omnitrophica bacterium]|nr:hypothetical protein [Candidatus Omnitrophota bacterium]
MKKSVLTMLFAMLLLNSAFAFAAVANTDVDVDAVGVGGVYEGIDEGDNDSEEIIAEGGGDDDTGEFN